MKTVLSIALILLLVSCEKETFEQPSKGLLKRKLEYGYIQDTILKNVSEYQYDWKRRLVKIQGLHSAQLFEYNQNDQLIRKYSYQVDGSHSILQDTTVYTYQNGNLVYEERFPVPESDYTYVYQIKYEYENSRLVKKKEYSDHEFREMTVYEYKNDLCSKEITYTDSLKSRDYFFVDYAYDDHRRKAVSSSRSSLGWFFVAGYYFYDDAGNLIWEYGEQMTETPAYLGFYNRYEYY